MHQTTVTIGRNVPSNNNEPMSDREWADFQNSVVRGLYSTLAYQGEGAAEAHYGVGTWDGVSEESCKISVLHPEPMSEGDKAFLRGWLQGTKINFYQDAIAFITGESELV